MQRAWRRKITQLLTTLLCLFLTIRIGYFLLQDTQSFILSDIPDIWLSYKDPNSSQRLTLLGLESRERDYAQVTQKTPFEYSSVQLEGFAIPNESVDLYVNGRRESCQPWNSKNSISCQVDLRLGLNQIIANVYGDTGDRNYEGEIFNRQKFCYSKFATK